MFITNYNNQNDDDEKDKEEQKRKSLFDIFKKKEENKEEDIEDPNLYNYYDELEKKEQEELKKQEMIRKQNEEKRKQTPGYHAVSSNTNEYKMDTEKMKIYAQAEEVKRRYSKEDVKTYEDNPDPFLKPQSGYKIVGVMLLIGIIVVMIKLLGTSTKKIILETQFNEVGVVVNTGLNLKYYTNDLNNTIFKSNDDNICEVNERTGYVLGVHSGTCTITITNKTEKASKDVKVYVVDSKNQLEDFSTPTNITLSRGDETVLDITLIPANTTNPIFTYYSTNEKVCTIDDRGIIKATGRGTTTIKVISNNKIEKKINITVK